MAKNLYNVAVVGATGLVGCEIIEALAARRFPVGELRLYSSMNTAGTHMDFMGDEIMVQPLAADFHKGLDLAFFAVHPMVSRDMAEDAASDGCLVIDSSRAFRLDPQVPLVVPEINAHELKEVRRKKGITASPSAAATALALVVNPVMKKYGVKRVFAATTHGSTSAGRSGFEEHQQQTIAIFNQQDIVMERFTRQSAFNIYPKVGEFQGETSEEETDIEKEIPKILGKKQMSITVTAAMIPIFCGITAAVNIETKKPASLKSFRSLLEGSPGVHVMDSPSEDTFPDTLAAMAQDEVLVGRIRKDPTLENGFNLWISADNLKKGSALNMIQIAETILGL